jgi:hypothetical protein
MDLKISITPRKLRIWWVLALNNVSGAFHWSAKSVITKFIQSPRAHGIKSSSVRSQAVAVNCKVSKSIVRTKHGKKLFFSFLLCDCYFSRGVRRVGKV